MAGILIVDDDGLTRTVVKRMLETGHHTVFQAANGHEALQMVSTSAVDVVITDILMPERDGLDVVAQVRGTHPWIKVLAYSGGGSLCDFDVLIYAKEAGAHAALQKPFSVSDLLGAVEELLRRPA